MQLALPLDSIRRSPKPFSRAKEDATVLVRHRRARRYIIRILDDGTLRVTLPWRGSKREAMAFVDSNAEWIAAERLRRSSRPPVIHNLPAVRARGLVELPPQLLELARRHDISVTRVSIRNQRSRWGACSARGSITLNWRLILVPDFVREYVMIHELMHRRELDHSKRFWGHVRAACPRYREARQWLLTEGPRLFSL